MEVTLEDLNEIKKAGESILVNELKSFYLLGNTNEYDKFDPQKLDYKKCSDFEKYKYACCVYAGYKIDEDEQKAYKIWETLANEGQVDSMVEYSAYLFQNKKDEEAFKMIQSAANEGNKLAQFRVALCYMFGLGVKQDEKKSFYIFEKMAEDNYPNAVYMIGSFYMADSGIFVQRDSQKGWELIKKAAKLGSPYAQYEVAIQLSLNNDNQSFSPDAIRLLINAADGGDLRAQYILALAYAKGEGVKPDLEKSMDYLAQCYDAGFPLAIELMEKIKNNFNN